MCFKSDMIVNWREQKNLEQTLYQPLWYQNLLLKEMPMSRSGLLKAIDDNRIIIIISAKTRTFPENVLPERFP